MRVVSWEPGVRLGKALMKITACLAVVIAAGGCGEMKYGRWGQSPKLQEVVPTPPAALRRAEEVNEAPAETEAAAE